MSTPPLNQIGRVFIDTVIKVNLVSKSVALATNLHTKKVFQKFLQQMETSNLVRYEDYFFD